MKSEKTVVGNSGGYFSFFTQTYFSVQARFST